MSGPGSVAAATLKRQLANRRRWHTRTTARRDLIRWIEGSYNGHRPYSNLNYSTPIKIEDLHYHHHDSIAA